MDIKLICDSMCDIPDEISAKDYVEVVPLTIIMDGKEYRDGIDITKEVFYDKVMKSNEIPKTSQATYAQFKDVFDKAVADNKKVICITGASTASGTYQSAVLAKNDTEGDIEIYDTELLSLGAGQYVIRACDLIEEGKDVKEIVEELDKIKSKGVQILFAPATFDYLKKSGRVPMAAAVLGNVLNIKPLFKMDSGKVSIDAKVRGIKKLVSKMVDNVIERNPDLGNLTVTIGHGCNLDDFEKLKEEVDKKLKDKVKKIFITKGGVCVCSHTGPDIIAISFSN